MEVKVILLLVNHLSERRKEDEFLEEPTQKERKALFYLSEAGRANTVERSISVQNMPQKVQTLDWKEFCSQCRFYQVVPQERCGQGYNKNDCLYIFYSLHESEFCEECLHRGRKRCKLKRKKNTCEFYQEYIRERSKAWNGVS